MPAKPDHDDHKKIVNRDREEDERDERFLASFLARAISLLAHELREVREVLRNGFECFKSHSPPATKCDLKELECKIMATQAEVVEELRTLKGQVGKIRTEVTDAKNELQATIKRLEDLIAAGNTGEASAELVSIKDELKAELQTLDDLHLDTPPAPV